MSAVNLSDPCVLSREEAIERIAAVQSEINALLQYVESICDYHDLTHSINIAYGMGGTYSNGQWESSSSNC